jgi:hypothetical protein
MKVTREVFERRLKLTVDLMARGHYRGEIKKAIMKAEGIGRGTADDYLRRAKQYLLDELGYSSSELKSHSIAWYRKIVTDERVPMEIRMQARARMDKLFGLEAALRIDQNVQQNIDINATVRHVEIKYENDWDNRLKESEFPQ